jgi:hypothetical protein
MRDAVYEVPAFDQAETWDLPWKKTFRKRVLSKEALIL